MASFNRVILAGNLTRDPEIKTASSGRKVADLRLAVSETYRDKQTQEKKEITCFVDVAVWGNQADVCQQYLAKGSNVLIEGRLQYDEWKNDKGETRSKLRVRADRVQFLGSPQRKAEAMDGPQGGAPVQRPAATSVASESAPDADFGAASGDDDDLPF